MPLVCTMNQAPFSKVLRASVTWVPSTEMVVFALSEPSLAVTVVVPETTEPSLSDRRMPSVAFRRLIFTVFSSVSLMP